MLCDQYFCTKVIKFTVCNDWLGLQPFLRRFRSSSFSIRQLREARMSVGDIGLIFTSILTLKQLYVDVEGNKKDCRNLIARCSALEKPLQAIQADKERLLSSQEALVGLQSVLEDCVAFCRKYTGKRWLVKAYRNIHGGDKERFAELNARISASSTDLQLGVNFDSISGVSQGIFNLRNHLGDDMTEIKARMSELTNMVQDLLQSRGTSLAEPLNVGMVLQVIQNSEDLLKISEVCDGSETDMDNHQEPPPPSSMRSTSSGTTTSTLTSSTYSSHSVKTQSSLLPIDHSQLIWLKEPANRLGAGAFGAVYKCEYLRTPCALKHFACLTLHSPTVRELGKIQREARILQLASFHPNIIGYRGVDLDLGILLMELATCSLHDILYREDKHSLLPIDSKYLPILHTFAWKMHVLMDLISALSFLHFHSVLHRDIKSANILFVHDPSRLAATGLPLVAKLSDFGLASAVGLSSSGLSVSGSTGCAVGTSVYMAPELLDFEHRPQYSPASDVYALGILANEILTEKAPWSGLRDIHVLNMVVNKHQRPAGYVSNDHLEQYVMKKVIGDSTTGSLHQDAQARPAASILTQYLQEYMDFLAEEVNVIKPFTEKVVSIDRPALMRQVASALFPTISDEELVEMTCMDPPEENSLVVETTEKNDVVSVSAAPAVTHVSETFSEEALSERLVDEFEFEMDLESEPSGRLEDTLSAPATPFAPYPEAPDIVCHNGGVRSDESLESVVDSAQLVSLSLKSEKPIKPVKPASLKAKTTPAVSLESNNDPVFVADSALQDRIVALLARLTASSTNADSASAANQDRERSERHVALRELIEIVQEGSSQQTLIASLGGIAAVVGLLCQLTTQDQVRGKCQILAEDSILVAQLIAFLAKKHPFNQGEFARHGVLAMLVHVLVHTTEEAVKESVVGALVFLISNHAENQVALVELQGLSEVISFVLNQRHTQGCAEALRLLTDITISHRDFLSIVLVLQHGPEVLQVKMAQLIGILAENNVDNQDALSATHVMPVLITHLSEGSEELVEHSVQAMKCLATKHAVNREAIVSAGGIEPLTLLITGGLGTARVAAMDLLRVICSHTPSLRAQIATPEVLNTLRSIRENKVTAKFVKQSAELLSKELSGSSGFTMPSFITNFAQGRGK